MRANVFMGFWVATIVFVNTKKHGSFVDKKFQKYFCYYPVCMCTENKANCIGHEESKLHFIPQLPNNISEIYFTGNDLSLLNSETLQNISFLHLKVLDLSNNNVTEIARDTFKKLSFIEQINLSKNDHLNVDEVSNALSSLNKSSIKHLTLNYMEWKNLPKNMFVSLLGSGLKLLHLSYSSLTHFDGSCVSGLTNLTELNLGSNQLRSLNFSGLYMVIYLDIPDNSLDNVPNFCHNQSETSLVPNLEELNMNDNKIKKLTEGSFRCLPKLIKLTISKNPLYCIGNNFILSLQKLEILYMDEIGSMHVTPRYENYAFNSSSIKRLYFRNNLLQNGFYSPRYLFMSCVNLEYLIMSNTYLTTSTVKSISLFLKNLIVLRLDNTGLQIMPVVRKIRSLIELSLTANKIYSWNGTEVFAKSSITYLYLNKNRISVINETSFPPLMLRMLRHLDLSDNPFACTCLTIPSVKWFRKDREYVLNYPQKYKCDSPPALKGILLKDYNPSPESCREKNIALLVAVPVSIVVIVAGVTVSLIYKCRWRLRYGVYLLTTKYNGYQQISNDEDCIYAGFVIYSDDDRTWVHNELVHRIEKQEGFRLCIRLRDFDVGKIHVDNIVENMLLSRKIIIILSNNFAKDEWCHFQLLLAETRLLKENLDVLVLLMLEEINSNLLRSSLYKLVANKRYAIWSSDPTGNSLFWDQAVSEMKTSTNIN